MNGLKVTDQTGCPERTEILNEPDAATPIASPGHAGIMPNGVSVPSHFPHIEITINDNPDPGYIFIDNRATGLDSYSVIFDNNGSPVWYWQADYERRNTIVQHNGLLTMLVETDNLTPLFHYIGLDTNYNHVATYVAANGYYTDEHELQVLADGNYLLIGIRFNHVDMTLYAPDGNPDTIVGETVIQEFTPQGELIFQWRAWDNYDITDIHFDDVHDSGIRFPHMNAIDIDTDGHILVSCRHLSEITKINRDSGKIIWRLSGIPKNNDFTFTNDPLNGFFNQHAIRTTGPNRYLLFDNGNLRDPPRSRAVEYELDPENKTAEIIWQYPETTTPSIYTKGMANAQRLDNGNTLINWSAGELPKITEVRPDGTIAFEMNWVDKYITYRVWRCQWNGIASKPNLVIEPYPDNITLLFNKFGDPDVDHYNIYAGTAQNPNSIIATSKTTLTQLTNLTNGTRYYFRVTAVDSQGRESDFSDEKDIFVNIIEPGRNMVINGDFSSDKNYWSWKLSDSASAQWEVNDGVSFFNITDPGSETSDIQLLQDGMKLTQGKKYLLQFDARSIAPRYIEVSAGSRQSPWTDYSRMIPPFIIPVQQHYRHVFSMNSPSDYNARISFNLGTFAQSIYLDNISLTSLVPGDFDDSGCVEYNDLEVMVNQWLQNKNGLSADLDDNDIVEFNDFVIMARSWLRFCDQNF